ncbi:MAG TPA: hypothetical protein GXX25_15225, partial [Desulfotomaculum sp.]|nr:hypothetical protein [Desulfotomaculum sp.]
FNLYANPGVGQRFYYCRGGGTGELPRDDQKALAVGEVWGALVSGEGALGMITSLARGQVRGCHSGGGPWQLQALQRVRVPPGEKRRVAVYLVAAAGLKQIQQYRVLADATAGGEGCL